MALSFGLKTIADWLHKTVARLQVTSENNSGTEREFQTLTPMFMGGYFARLCHQQFVQLQTDRQHKACRLNNGIDVQEQNLSVYSLKKREGIKRTCLSVDNVY